MPTDLTPPDEPEGLAEVHLDPITIEVMGNALISIPDEMLAALIKSAYSSNIKERQDCSTVIIDADGRLAVPSGMSIPIHLSSFELTGAAILQRFPKESLRPGDVFAGERCLHRRSLPSRRHHLRARRCLTATNSCASSPIRATGRTWGERPAARHPSETRRRSIKKGCVSRRYSFTRRGVLRHDLLEMILLNVRDSEDREGDVRAHVGCLKLGEKRLHEMIDRYGGRILRQALREMQGVSEIKTRHGISKLPEGEYTAVDYLDDDVDSDEPIPHQCPDYRQAHPRAERNGGLHRHRPGRQMGMQQSLSRHRRRRVLGASIPHRSRRTAQRGIPPVH